MKVLVATTSTQGSQLGDHSWTVEGELVTPLRLECGAPAACGCGRGFVGLGSGRSTTTAMVVERPLLGREDVWDAVESALERAGRLDGLTDEEVDDVVGIHVESIDLVGERFAPGAVVSRWGAHVYDRSWGEAA